MDKNINIKRCETLVQLLVLSVAIVTPFVAFNFMDLELFSVSKSMLLTIWSSINPWLYPPYVYLLINFIIFFIFASSFIHSNTTFSNPSYDHNQSFTNSFIESSESYELGSLSNDETKFHIHKMEDTFIHNTIINDGLKCDKLDDHVVEETVVDKRELRKSRTFHEGGSRTIGRRERYVKVLSQEELDRRVEAFIYRFKKDKKVK